MIDIVESSGVYKYVEDYTYAFIQAIYIAPLQVHNYSEALPTQHEYCVGVNTPKRHRQLRVKNLPKVPTWWLEWDSYP